MDIDREKELHSQIEELRSVIEEHNLIHKTNMSLIDILTSELYKCIYMIERMVEEVGPHVELWKLEEDGRALLKEIDD